MTRRHDAPTCARCGAELLDGRVLSLDDTSFGPFASRLDLPLLVQMWAPWSGPSRDALPALRDAARQLRGDAMVARVNVNQALTLMSHWAVESLPALLLFDHGRELRRTTEPLAGAALLRWLAGASR